MSERLLRFREAGDIHSLHSGVYTQMIQAGEKRDFLFTPFGANGAIVRRKDGDTPEYKVGESLRFFVRTNPMTRVGGARKQLSLGVGADPLRRRWFEHVSTGRGFEVIDYDMRTWSEVVRGGSKAFSLHLTSFFGTLLVTDAEVFCRSLFQPIGRSSAWGCGMLVVGRDDA